MKIIVCAKQVPDTTDVKIDPVKNTIIREGIPSILNPDDANALEEALRIKDERPETEVVVLSMGPPQASVMLNECLAMGADKAVLVSDRAVGGSDTWATSNALAAAIQKIGDYDLVFTGRQAIDGDTAQVGPQIAEKLDLPQVTYVSKVDVGTEAGKLVVTKEMETNKEVVEISLPCLLTATKELNKPRYMNMKRIYELQEDSVTVWNAADIQVDLETVGLQASPTRVFNSFTPAPKTEGVFVEGETELELAENLVKSLKEKHFA